MEDGRQSVTRVTLGALFIAFLKVSLLGFGGGLVWARRITVEQGRWISEEEFADILSLCQFMPGPNVVGIAVCAGAMLRGLIGAIAAASGFLLIPWTVGFSLGVMVLHYAHLVVLQNILRGVSSVAAGLLIATGIRMLMPHRHHLQAIVVAALAVGGIGFAKLPLLVVLFSLAPVSIAVAAFTNAKAQ
ncbi:MAG TPA: chromate transporter [Acetobacteraceae bacterium]|nr:chromate transporter [Acetobacteraceae bacterium]